MRLFEIVLIIINFCTLGWMLFSKGNKKKINVFLLGVLFIATIIQISAEGYRTHMLSAYICLLINLLCLVRKGKKHSKVCNLILAVIYTIFNLIAAVVFRTVLPALTFEKPTGAYKVGTVTYDWTDETRLEETTKDSDDKRELMVQVWYPTESTDNLKRELLTKDAREVMKGFQKQYAVPSFLFTHLKYVKSNSYSNAKLSGKQQKYPLVIFSHGFGLFRGQNIFEVEELASHGYIVVGIDHAYDAAATVFSNGRVAQFSHSKDEILNGEFLDYMDSHNEVWVKDVQFVLDKIEEINKKDPENNFTGRIDLDKIGMFGHSYGGATAAQILMCDSRVKAGINMDGAFAGKPIPANGLGKPFMLMDAEMSLKTYKGDNSDFEKVRGMTDDLRKKYIDYYSKMYIKRNEAISNGGYSLLIHDTSHLSYTGLSLLFPVINISLESPGNVYKIVNDFTLTFFNKYLLGDTSASLENTAHKYNNVELAGDKSELVF